MEFEIKFSGSAKVFADTKEDAMEGLTIKPEYNGGMKGYSLAYDSVEEVKHSVVMGGQIYDYDLLKKNPQNAKWPAIYDENDIDKSIAANDGIVIESHVYTPLEFAETFVIEAVDDVYNNMTIEAFDKVTSDKYGLWNYPLSESGHILENELDTVIVKFNDGLRLVQVN